MTWLVLGGALLAAGVVKLLAIWAQPPAVDTVSRAWLTHHHATHSTHGRGE